MDSPGFFIVIILIIFFALWVVGGGPSKPISFSGPFITPISDVGETQSGYGPQINPNASLTVPGGSVSVGEKTQQGPTPSETGTTPAPVSQSNTPGNSQYAGKVTMERSTENTTANPGQKYDEFILTSNVSSPMTLLDWQILSNADEAHIFIPNGKGTSFTLSAGQPVLFVTPFPSSFAHDTVQLIDGDGNVVDTLTY